MNLSSNLRSEKAAIAATTMMLMLARIGGAAQPKVAAGASSLCISPMPASASLAGKVLGLIAFGEAGRAVAKRARLGFGMRILAHDAAPVDQQIDDELGIEPVASIDDLLPAADFVSLHGDVDTDDRPVIDARRLTLMKPYACLINTAHGALVDEQALIHALWFETIGGVGMAVPSSQIRRAADILVSDRAIILPHQHDTMSPPGPGTNDNVIAFPGNRAVCDRR